MHAIVVVVIKMGDSIIISQLSATVGAVLMISECQGALGVIILIIHKLYPLICGRIHLH